LQGRRQLCAISMTTSRQPNPLESLPPSGQAPQDYSYSKPDIVQEGFDGRGSGLLVGIAVTSSTKLERVT
jgi:hypothetical protein